MNAIDRMTQYLSEHHVPFELIPHKHTATSRQAAVAAGIGSRRLAKAVLLETPEYFLAAMIPADEQVRLGKLSQEYGKSFRLATEADVCRVFEGCDPGAAPGLPIAWGIETVWEDDLLAQPDLYLEAGDHESLIHVETKYLREAMQEIAHSHFAQPHTWH